MASQNLFLRIDDLYLYQIYPYNYDVLYSKELYIQFMLNKHIRWVLHVQECVLQTLDQV